MLGPVDLTARGASTACWLRGHRLMRTCFKANAAHHTYHRDGTHPPHIPRRSTRLKQVRPRWELCVCSQQQQLLFRVCLLYIPSHPSPRTTLCLDHIRRVDCSVCWGRGNLLARGWALIDERCNGRKGGGEHRRFKGRHSWSEYALISWLIGVGIGSLTPLNWKVFLVCVCL